MRLDRIPSTHVNILEGFAVVLAFMELGGNLWRSGIGHEGFVVLWICEFAVLMTSPGMVTSPNRSLIALI